jgi:hypothetical protein
MPSKFAKDPIYPSHADTYFLSGASLKGLEYPGIMVLLSYSRGLVGRIPPKTRKLTPMGAMPRIRPYHGREVGISLSEPGARRTFGRKTIEPPKESFKDATERRLLRFKQGAINLSKRRCFVGPPLVHN